MQAQPTQPAQPAQPAAPSSLPVLDWTRATVEGVTIHKGEDDASRYGAYIAPAHSFRIERDPRGGFYMMWVVTLGGMSQSRTGYKTVKAAKHDARLAMAGAAVAAAMPDIVKEARREGNRAGRAESALARDVDSLAREAARRMGYTGAARDAFLRCYRAGRADSLFMAERAAPRAQPAQPVALAVDVPRILARATTALRMARKVHTATVCMRNAFPEVKDGFAREIARARSDARAAVRAIRAARS